MSGEIDTLAQICAAGGPYLCPKCRTHIVFGNNGPTCACPPSPSIRERVEEYLTENGWTQDVTRSKLWWKHHQYGSSFGRAFEMQLEQDERAARNA